MYKEGIVKADNRAILIGKLLQAYGGAVYTKDKAIINLSPKSRISTAETIADSAAGKVLIFTAYKHTCEMVFRELSRSKSDKYDGGPMAMVHGDTPLKERYEIFRSFQDANDPLRRIVAHPKCMSHGLNLTEADTIIWYQPYQGYETYQQANGRITRAGQTRRQLIYHLRASSVEDKVYNTLVTNGNMQATLLELFETEFT
jgi:SNF2 family DNA or RNA helicase